MWKKVQVNIAVRHSCYRPALGGEGSGSPVMSYVVALWGESGVARHAHICGVW